MNSTNQFHRWMKASASGLMLCLGLAGITSCQLRDIGDADSQVKYILDIDWSNLEEDPTGMTVMFYPVGGGNPIKRVSNEVHHVEYLLPNGEYDLLVFNQTEEEFESILFRGLNAFNTAEAYAPETTDKDSRIDRLYRDGTRGYAHSARLKPGTLAAGARPATTTNGTRGYAHSARLKPPSKVGNLSITVHLYGSDNIQSMNGALSGLASSAYLTSDQLGMISLTEELNDWAITTNAGVGSVSTSFGTFGISPNVESTQSSVRAPLIQSETAYTEHEEEDDYRNILYLNFLLKDGTYVPYRFDVTDRIIESIHNVYIELELFIGIDLNGDPSDELDYPLVLPESGLPYEGYGLSVRNWDTDETEHNVIMY